MKDHPILVRKIAHLTDARYFAAMGVDYMSMRLSLDSSSFDQWHGIREWVEGVRWLAEPDSENESLIAKVIIDAKPDGMIITPAMLPDVSGEMELFMIADSVVDPPTPLGVNLILDWQAELLDINIDIPKPGNLIFIQTDWTPAHVQDLLDRGYAGGFCFSGGAEDQLGVKDYSAFDQMISMIQ